MKKVLKVVGLVVAAFVFLLIGVGIGASGTSKPTTGPIPTVTKTVLVPVTATPTTSRASSSPVNSGFSGDGVFVVGLDIKRGTYHTAGAKPDFVSNCYYALLSSTNTSDIIDNNNVTGPATITVGPGVKAVETSGCKPWVKI